MIRIFLENLEYVFGWLFRASWQASVLVALVLLMQWAFRTRLNSRWTHALWLLVIARLLLPALPASALSLFQFAPPPPPVIVQSVTAPIFPPVVPTVAVDLSAVSLPPYPISLCTVFALIWLVGALGLLLVTGQVNRRFGRHVRNAPQINDPVVLQIAAAAKTELGLHRSLRLIESAHVQGPAIMGLIYPTLILPQNVGAKFTDGELRFIFLHEFAHLKRGDLILQWLVAILQILHWFNPVLWYAFRRMRADREPATDALVLSRTGEVEQYGQVLIKLLEHYHQRHALPTLVGILEDKDQFKRRFTLIGQFTRGAYGWSLLGAALIALLGVVCLTKAQAHDATSEPKKYLEVTIVEVPGATNSAGGLLRSSGEVAQMLADPKNKVSVLSDTVLKDGPISLQGDTPAGFHYKITGNWKTSIKTQQKISYRIDEKPAQTFRRAWETSDSISEEQSILVLEPWKPTSQANLLIRIVDHPGSANVTMDSDTQSPATNADPKTALASSTQAQLVLALDDNAKTIPSDHKRLQILQAYYGADGSWREVTGILQKSVQNNSLRVSWQQPYAEIGGDPAFLQVKTLAVSYRLDGVEKLATFREENPPIGLQATLPTKDDSQSSNALAQQISATHKGSIEMGLKVIEIPDDVYLANKSRVDAAVDKGDIGFFINLKDVNLLSAPSVSTQAGTKATIEIVRKFPFPVKFDPAERVSGSRATVPITPTEFATKDVGISAEITPTINPVNSPEPGKIVLNGKFSVSVFDGFTGSSVIGPGLPSFTTSESFFLEQLDDHELKGIWIPGEHVALQNPTAANSKPGWEMIAPALKKRYLLFVSASLVKTRDQIPSMAAIGMSDEGKIFTVRAFLAPPGFFHGSENDSVHAQKVLTDRGVRFPLGSTLAFVPGSSKFVVRDTPEQLDRIAHLLEKWERGDSVLDNQPLILGTLVAEGFPPDASEGKGSHLPTTSERKAVLAPLPQLVSLSLAGTGF